jgi:hypothetical protein
MPSSPRKPKSGFGCEPQLLAELRNDLPGNSVAHGRSESAAISRDKLMAAKAQN